MNVLILLLRVHLINWALRDYGIEGQIWDGGADCQHKFPEDNIRRIRGDVKNFTNKPIVGSNANEYQSPTRNSGAVCKKCGAWRGSLGLEPIFDLYIKHLCDIFDEVKRILKKTGTCWVNMGDTFLAQQGKGFPGTGQVNIPDRDKNAVLNIKRPKSIPNKCLAQIPSRFSIEMCNRGWILRNVIIWHKPNCMPSSVKDRFTVDFEYIFFFVKNKKYWFERQFEEYTLPMNRWGGVYTDGNVEGSKYQDKHLDPAQLTKRPRNMRPNPQGRNKRCVWTITTKPFKDAHFAVFPEELVETPIKAGCPKSGVVLDPFCGSGTTCVVAKRLNRNYLGIELSPDYVKMAEKRIANTQRSML